MNDEIKAPLHYVSYSIEPWQVIESWGLNFALGNVIKYIARAPMKGGITDLMKAQECLRREIERQRKLFAIPEEENHTA